MGAAPFGSLQKHACGGKREGEGEKPPSRPAAESATGKCVILGNAPPPPMLFAKQGKQKFYRWPFSQAGATLMRPSLICFVLPRLKGTRTLPERGLATGI